MGRTTLIISLTIALTFLLSEARSCRKRVFRDVSRNSRGLEDTVNDFTRALGGVDNGERPGPLFSGFRSINWDGRGVPFDMPGDFFVNTRGLKVTAKGGEFRVSNPPGPPADDKFDSINRNAAKDFITFSPPRLFTPLKDNKVAIHFFIPGTKGRTGACVKGFGAVYVDVDKKRVTSATYYDKKGKVLASEYVDPKNKGLSFLGVIFKKPVIAKVELKLGDAPLIKKRGDWVVLDDFFYGEPAECQKC